MYTNTVQTANVEAVPFFARFLEEQVAEVSDTAPYNSTKKYPSDWEEY
ncbi:microviridin/marinostatin family tricyclic proteinase inhibitor [Anabaena azotica]|uniref:Microviridin/marinostatin family tricyclic proteinase inhibitor n=1 Tax=Anabaena azotica FACHB-119 TaxID=947527 RepID=A0ABR8D8A3_9NOST|nr:microviridin/marinostatin family tricyclic proteinase inhibitor [Anabaena azotica]MBD2502505.1 microviridin/marinostatin family tricyclic proteinase inhibitor [Anabaena azotica FACHB-119]